jgi:uncharacterized protein YkwD
MDAGCPAPARSLPPRLGKPPSASESRVPVLRAEPALVLRHPASHYQGPQPREAAPKPLGPLHAACVAAAARRGASLRWDARLRRAARSVGRLLERLPAHRPGALTFALTFALQGAGVVEPHARLLEADLTPGTPAQVRARRARFARRVARLVDREGYNLAGGVVLHGPGSRRRALWVLLRSHLRLAAVLRRPAADASILLRGAVGRGYAKPRVVVTAPQGETTLPRLTAATDGSFHAVVPLPGGAGIYQVEILATGPGGPVVLANFPLYAGVTPPRRYLLRPGHPAPRPPPDHQSASRALWSRVQRLRRRRGLRPLRWHQTLGRVARAHSLFMCRSRRVLHHSPQTGTASDRVRRSGLRRVRWVGENVGRAPSVPALHRSFMQSPGHRAMRLDGRATHGAVGTCLVRRPGGVEQIYTTEIYVQMAARRAPPAPARTRDKKPSAR